MSHATLVIPCFNEARRLPVDELAAFVARRDVELMFVDDGSKDGTANVIRALRDRAGSRIELIPLLANGGKGEAVRAGLRAALDRGARIVGYLDADLATPLEEAWRLLQLFDEHVAVVTAARVALMGSAIERTRFRHYAGRVFATCAALALHSRYYDTQCGAKFFRAGPALESALAEPFISPWLFDVELLGRLLTGPAALAPSQIREEALRSWRDVAGSRLKPGVFVRAPLELGRIALAIEARRRSS